MLALVTMLAIAVSQVATDSTAAAGGGMPVDQGTLITATVGAVAAWLAWLFGRRQK